MSRFRIGVDQTLEGPDREIMPAGILRRGRVGPQTALGFIRRISGRRQGGRKLRRRRKWSVGLRTAGCKTGYKQTRHQPVRKAVQKQLGGERRRTMPGTTHGTLPAKFHFRKEIT